MATKSEKYQKLYHLYKTETGTKEVDANTLAGWAMSKGMEAPTPKTPRELLAAEFSQALREEYQRDPKTGWEYRVNHATRHKDSEGKQQTLWHDIHEVSRKKMHLSLTNRRQQMIGDGVQLKIDETVWNRLNPDEDPIQMILDFTDDVEERLNSPDMEKAA
jgi:hypothetical protein